MSTRRPPSVGLFAPPVELPVFLPFVLRFSFGALHRAGAFDTTAIAATAVS